MRGRLIRFGSNMFFKGKSYELPMEIWKAIENSQRNIDETQSIYKSVLFLESYGEAEDWDEPIEWISSKSYCWIFEITVPPYNWGGKIIPSEIASEIERGRGEMPNEKSKKFGNNFFRCVYE